MSIPRNPTSFVVNHSRLETNMASPSHDNIVLSLKNQDYINTRPFRKIVLALSLALAVLAFAAAPMFAQSPNILVDDFINIPVNRSVEIEVFANDSILDLASFDLTRPENGKLNSFTFNASTPTLSFSYTPNSNFAGRDSFMYKIADSQGDVSYATVHITVYADLDCSTCLISHAATPINITIGADGAFNYHFIGDGGIATGPLLPPVQKLAEMHSPGSGNIVLYNGQNSISGASVVISYLSTEQVIHVNTSYLNRHDGSMKPYIFVINQNNEVSHWEW
jgi:hypothetical protein